MYRQPPLPLDICSCCVPDDIGRQLAQWPLKRLTALHFYEYNTSAKDEAQDPREIGYFLPRMLELLTSGKEVHHSTELALDRLGRCPRDSWTPAQHAVLAQFALACFDLLLREGTLSAETRTPAEDPLSVLLMFDIGGVDVGPLLALWLDCDHPLATAQFVQTTYWDFWTGQTYSNPFASERPAFREQIHEWLLAPSHRERFAAKLLHVDFLTFAASCPPVGCTTFSTMVDGVFEQLTY